MASILDYLQTTYGIDGFVDQKLWIDPFSLSLPWEGRQSLLKEAEDLFHRRFKARSTTDRNNHPIGVVGGHPGIGKSRALVELIDPIKSWHGLSWTIPVVISYNNGNSPFMDKKMAPSVALALRILYFAVVAGRTETTSLGDIRVTFETFATSMPIHLREQLTPQLAVQALSILAERKCGSADGMVYVAVDEVNYLLDDAYSGETQKRAFLKGTMMALGELLLSGAVFVFGVVAGTTVTPLEKICAELSRPIRKLPIGLLSYAQCETLLDNLAIREPAIWRDWRTCRTFQTLVADYGSIPRKLETLLRYVREAMMTASDGIGHMKSSMHDVEFGSIYTQLQNTTKSMGLLKRYALSLITAVLLVTPVRRDTFVLEGDASATSCWTYGALEEEGYIVLATVKDGGTIVQLPYNIFRKLVATLNDTDPLTLALRRACHLTTDNHYSDGFSWQSFAVLHGTVEAIREMLLARSKAEDEDKAMGLNEFYGTSYPVSSAVEDTLEFELRSHCNVVNASSRSLLLDAAGTCPGALFDTFTVRQISGGVRPLVCGSQQQKSLDEAAMKEVTKEMVRDETAKVALELSDAFEHVLVIVATTRMTESFGDDDDQSPLPPSPPDHCLLLTGAAALERFYGLVFSGRVILAMSGTRVDINTAPYLELRTVPGIGDTLAKRIINNRKNAPIASWSDALARVMRLPSASERYWRF